MGKKKQRAIIEKKKEDLKKSVEKENEIKKQKYFEKESIFISITVLFFIIDLFSITTLCIFFSDILFGNNASQFGIFVKILVLGIINGLVLIYITMLLKRFIKKK